MKPTSLTERIKAREVEREERQHSEWVAYHIRQDRRRKPRWLDRMAKDMTDWRPDGAA